jgi:hypothetical protein
VIASISLFREACGEPSKLRGQRRALAATTAETRVYPAFPPLQSRPVPISTVCAQAVPGAATTKSRVVSGDLPERTLRAKSHL